MSEVTEGRGRLLIESGIVNLVFQKNGDMWDMRVRGEETVLGSFLKPFEGYQAYADLQGEKILHTWPIEAVESES
jgi:hypothetical protein